MKGCRSCLDGERSLEAPRSRLQPLQAEWRRSTPCAVTNLADTRGTGSAPTPGPLPASSPRRALCRTPDTYEHPPACCPSCPAPVRHARPISGLANCDEVAPHPRLLPPRPVARLMSGQDDARATCYFALDLDGFYRTTADDAGSAGPSMGLGTRRQWGGGPRPAGRAAAPSAHRPMVWSACHSGRLLGPSRAGTPERTH